MPNWNYLNMIVVSIGLFRFYFVSFPFNGIYFLQNVFNRQIGQYQGAQANFNAEGITFVSTICFFVSKTYINCSRLIHDLKVWFTPMETTIWIGLPLSKFQCYTFDKARSYHCCSTCCLQALQTIFLNFRINLFSMFYVAN